MNTIEKFRFFSQTLNQILDQNESRLKFLDDQEL